VRATSISRIYHWTPAHQWGFGFGLGWALDFGFGCSVKSAVKCNWFSRWLAAPGILGFWPSGFLAIPIILQKLPQFQLNFRYHTLTNSCIPLAELALSQTIVRL